MLKFDKREPSAQKSSDWYFQNGKEQWVELRAEILDTRDVEIPRALEERNWNIDLQTVSLVRKE